MDRPKREQALLRDPLVVYSIVEESLVFIPKHRAERLAAIHRAIWSSKTWGDFKVKLPFKLYKEVIQHLKNCGDMKGFEEYYKEQQKWSEAINREQAFGEYQNLPVGGRLSKDDDEFKPEQLPGFSDGDWPGWPAQEMLKWVPKKIQKEYGQIVASSINGYFLMLDPAGEKDIVKAFHQHGYLCVKDEALARRACGYEAEVDQDAL
jgi:hypothetical protein